MNTFLYFLLQNTLTGTAFLAAVLLFRKAAGKLSKLYVRVLWLLALLVLLLPPLPLGSLHTARNLIEDTWNTITETNTAQELSQDQAASKIPAAASNPKASADINRVPEGNGGSPDTGLEPPGKKSLPDDTDRAFLSDEAGHAAHAAASGGISTFFSASGLNAAQTGLLFTVWAFGALFVATVSLLQWLRLKKSVAAAVRIQPEVWSSDQIDTPFVMPGPSARIYLPAGMEQNSDQLADILMHERRHIKNHDPLIKCVALFSLLLHWFNPLAWISLRCMNRDMEMYCDECVLGTASMEQKQHYAQTLLDFACQRRGFLPAVYFGESSTKSRIRHILNMKQSRTSTKFVLLLCILVCGLSFLTAGNTRAEANTGISAAGTAGRSKTRLPGKAVTYRAQDSVEAAGKTNAAGAESSPEQSTSDTAIDQLTGTAPDSTQTGEGDSRDNAPEEEEFWADRTIVGIGHPGMEPGFDLSKEAILLDKTSRFTLYGKKDADAIIVETPDNCFIYAEVPYTSTYDVPPVILENDFDNDGENELAIITYVMHGTGVSIYSLFMTDHTADSAWKLFHYRDSDYIAALTPHFDTGYDSDGVHLLFDGVPTGITEQVPQEELDNQYGYYAGSQIAFRLVEKKILLLAELAGYSKINHAGEFPGHELDAEVRYLGEGKWELEDIHYADANLNELIEEAVPLHLTGGTNWVNEYYTVPGVVLESRNAIHESAIILSVSYDTKTLENNRAEVHVTLRLDNSETLTHLTVPVKRVPLDFGGMWWRIAGDITIL